MLSIDIEDIKTKQIGLLAMRSTVSQVSTTLNEINGEEEQISDPEDKIVEITSKEQKNEKRMKRIEVSLRDLWDNIKPTNI